MDWLKMAAKGLSCTAQEQAEARQSVLTKPPGSLGQLETVALNLAALQGKELPTLDKITIRVFAGDHGVVAEGVSAFPQVVTGEMIKNFSRGGAAITVLAKQLNAEFAVVNLGTVSPLETLPNVTHANIAPGTANFCDEPAMTAQQLKQALDLGKLEADTADEQGHDLFIGGEMGIGNTTSASALCAKLTNQNLEQWIGRGTGVDNAGLERKHKAISKALELHQTADTPLEVLRCLGGLEIAALVGAYIRCAQNGLPVLVDGFITSAAALVAVRINPSIRPWLIFSHCSDEAGHQHLLNELEAKPLITLGLRLGEASGAAIAVPLLQSACLLHGNMATFEQAGVSNKD